MAEILGEEDEGGATEGGATEGVGSASSSGDGGTVFRKLKVATESAWPVADRGLCSGL